MKHKVAILIVLLLGVDRFGLAQNERALTKEHVYLKFYSEVMSQERVMMVMLPRSYAAAADKRYPVLYMHDGLSVFVDWRLDELAQPLVAAGQAQEIIIVAIYNGGTRESRFYDYTPTRVAGLPKGGNADRYGQMIVEEIKPVIDHEFRTLPDQANTAIGGASLGGLVSLYLALKYPAIFGKVAVMSPSAYWDDQLIVREVKGLSSKTALKIWLDVGTEEGSRFVAGTQILRDALLKKGWQRDLDLKYLEAKGAEHNETAFARRAPEMLKFLFAPAIAHAPDR